MKRSRGLRVAVVAAVAAQRGVAWRAGDAMARGAQLERALARLAAHYVLDGHNMTSLLRSLQAKVLLVTTEPPGKAVRVVGQHRNRFLFRPQLSAYQENELLAAINQSLCFC